VTCVRIVGGGLTGVLAALEAHRLGARKIVLHERSEALGGVALPRQLQGAELREGCIYFGGPNDPIRSLLEAHGLGFEEFDNRFGSISPGGLYTDDFGGPALACAEIGLTRPAGRSLADRLAAYPATLSRPLADYAHWHLGCELSEIHESAATPLAVNRVFPVGADLAALAQAKRSSPLADELYAIPRQLWGRTANLTAALPRDGFVAMFRQVRTRLERLGVEVRERELVSPRQAMAEPAAGEVLVWAANPTPLFKALELPTPRLFAKTFQVETYRARFTGPAPFYLQNFTAQGCVFRAYVYRSGGETLVTAECVAEGDVRAELPGLLAPAGGLMLGERLSARSQPRWINPTIAAIGGLQQLRGAAAARFGPRFVAGAWESYAKGEKFAEVNAALAAALAASGASAAA
jgi:hypothetical protein